VQDARVGGRRDARSLSRRLLPDDPALRLLAVSVAVVAALLCVAAIGLKLWAARRGVEVDDPHLGDLLLGSLFPAAGAVVLWRQPRNPCGWVLLSAALVAVSALAHTWVNVAVTDPGSLPLVPVAVWFAGWTYTPYWLQGSLLPVLFPGGRLPSPRWRWYVRAVAAVFTLLVLVAAFKPDDDVEGYGLSNPLGVGPDSAIGVWAVLQFGSVMVLFAVATPIALVGMVLRIRRTSGRERAQLQWLLLGLAVLPAYALLSLLLDVSGGELGFALAFACIPLTLGIAVVRHSLLDIEVVVHRTVAYALLTVGGLLAYVALVALAGRYVAADGTGPVVAAVVVAAAAAGRSRLQALVDRRLFGSRRDPYAVVQRVGASTAQAAAPGEALAALVEAVRTSLRLPFVQVLDAHGDVAAESGAPVAGTHVVPVVDQGRQLGVLVVGRRSRRERLRTEEASALVDVARRAGALLSAQRMTTDLQRSYAQVLQVRDDERNRLRRDLHDGVGPALAGVALQLEGLAARLTGEEEQRAERARERVLETVRDVRRIVDDLRPAAVEESGLAAALRALATDEGDAVRVLVDVELPERLPQSVEVAAYRIAGEAVTNVLRHAGAATARVQARVVDGAVQIEVVDDGCGFTIPQQRGVGLASMEERARDLGGRLDVVSTPGGGTRVRAVLPA
jgi:signal transduction histidine kinase